MADGNSGLKLYSLGIVSKNKTPGDPWVEADPIEHLTMDKGAISVKTPVKTTTVNADGNKTTTSLDKVSTIKAKWIPFGHSNRDTSPDVIAGETIVIFGYADTQDFYWTTIFNEPTIRRQETVRYVYGNQPSGSSPNTLTSSYWTLFDTIGKKVVIHTSDNDGEAAQYDIEIDTKEGIFTIQDSLGNSVILESKQGRLTATTENEVIINTKRFTVNASESVEIISPKFTVNAADTATVNSSAMTINAPLSTTNGVSMTGGSGMSLSGDMQMQGNIAMRGNVEVDGRVHASSISEG